jgi:A/G-specific adenine glycosylase
MSETYQLTAKRAASIRSSLTAWYETNRVPLPWRLQFDETRDPYAVWVSEIMLQQTTIQVVAPVYEKFMKRFPTAFDLAQATEDEALLYCQGLGYYRRFRLLKKGVESLRYNGKKAIYPTSYEEWLEVPGVGSYTAAAISSITLNTPKPSIDGNWERVLSRLLAYPHLPKSTPALKLFAKIGANLICPEKPGDFNQAVMELGQKICRPTASPNCGLCPIAKFCETRKLGKQAQIPLSPPRKEWVRLDLDLTIPTNGDMIGLTTDRSSAAFLQGTRGFMLTRSSKADGLREVGRFTHTITHHKLSVRVLLADSTSKDYEWTAREQLTSRLVTSL